MNHRLRMAADLDLFDELERHMEEENRIIEEKSEHMSRMSMTMSELTKQAEKVDEGRKDYANTMIVEFDGF